MQAYWQLAVSGLPWVDLVCLLPRYDIRIVRVMADPAHQSGLMEEVSEWRERHLIRGEPLPIDGSDACRRGLVRRFPVAGEKLRPATAGESATMRSYAAIGAEIAHLERSRAALAAEIIAAIGDDKGMSGAGIKATRSIQRRSSIDAAALRASWPEIAEKVTREGEPFAVLRVT